MLYTLPGLSAWVSLQMLRDSCCLYQRTVKAVKEQFFWSNCLWLSQPQVLFKIINSVLNVPQSYCLKNTAEVCEEVDQKFTFFIYKVMSTRAFIKSSIDPCLCATCPAVFDQFEPVTQTEVEEIMSHMKPAGSPNDLIPPRLLQCVSICTEHY